MLLVTYTTLTQVITYHATVAQHHARSGVYHAERVYTPTLGGINVDIWYILFFLSFLNVTETYGVNSSSFLLLLQSLEAKCMSISNWSSSKTETNKQVKGGSFIDITDIDLFMAISSYFTTCAMRNAMSISLKFLVCIALLIFARGGIPRFRFDYLTKLGWIRFLSLVLLSFTIEILIVNVF